MSAHNFDFVKEQAEKTGDKLLSKVYVNNDSLLDMECSMCNEEYQQTLRRLKLERRHRNCPKAIK